jgi:hypothetical protein
MKSFAFIVALLVSLTLPGQAQLVVEDPASIAQDAVNQVVDLGKYIEMVNNQVRQIQTMTQELQQVTSYVRAFGNPAQLLNVTGADELVSSLQQSGVGATLGALQQTASGVESLNNSANGLYQNITDTSFSGVTVPRVAEVYKPFGALENTSANYATVYGDTMQRRQALQSAMAGTVTQLQSATTDAETQKLQGVLAGQSAQLQAIDQEIASAASQVAVQDAANRNDAEKQQRAQNEEIAADRHDAFTKFGAMMLPDVDNDLRFGRSSGQ